MGVPTKSQVRADPLAGARLVLLVFLFATAGFSPKGYGLEYVRFEASNSAQSEQVLLKAQLFRPHGAGPFPAVVLMHGCGGWQPAVLHEYYSSLVVLQLIG